MAEIGFESLRPTVTVRYWLRLLIVIQVDAGSIPVSHLSSTSMIGPPAPPSS